MFDHAPNRRRGPYGGQLSHAPVVCRDATRRAPGVRGAPGEIPTAPYLQPDGARGFSGPVAQGRSRTGARRSGGPGETGAGDREALGKDSALKATMLGAGFEPAWELPPSRF